MKVDLLTAIGELKGMTDAFVMTHNVDFVFLQTLALRAFNRGGRPRITVFADAHCAQDSFATQHRLLSGLGSRYRVVPVAMPPGFRFHPKAVLLAGEEAATLFVGSGNLGFAGWRENAEVWVRFDTATDGPAPFAQFREFATTVIDAVELNEGPRQVLKEIFDPARNRWAAAPAAGAAPLVVGRAGQGDDLLRRLVGACALNAVDELYVCCPYYDLHGEALKQLLEALKPGKTTLLYQPRGSTLSAGACAANPGAQIQHVGFARPERKWGGARQAFVHAKFYALRQGEQVIVLAGSANCSVAALTLRHHGGNAELMAVRRITRAEFEQDWLGALQLIEAGDGPPVDPNPGDEAEGAGTTKLSILAARFVAGRQLRVAFAPKGAHIAECRVDGVPVPFKIDKRGGCITMSCTDAPRAVELRGTVDGMALCSNLAWVDDEEKLRHAPVNSPALDAFKHHAHEGTWNAGAWAEVMDLFTKHLSEIPVPPARAPKSAAKQGHQRSRPNGSYAIEDVLASKATPLRPGSSASTIALQHLGGHHESTLPALLRRWFASPDDPPEDAPPPGTNSGDGQSHEAPPGSDGDDESVDGPTRFERKGPKRRVPGKRRPARPGVQMERILKAMKAALASPGFCAHRPAKLLGVDLQLIALLLGTALREGWISADQHLEMSCVAWGALFLDGGEEAPQGWLARRLEDEGEQAPAFLDELRSPQLIAALLGWAYGCDQAPPGPAAAAFELAAALAIARLPPDWFDESPEQTAQALGSFVLNAAPEAAEGEDLLSRVRLHWMRLEALGAALVELDGAFRAAGYHQLLERLPRLKTLEAGELLVQPNGYFIVRKQTVLAPGYVVPVDRVANPEQPTAIDHAGVAPVATILSSGLLPLSPTTKVALAKCLERLRGAHCPTPRRRPS